MRRISNSEIQVWKQCRRKWYLTFRRRLRPRREEPVGAAALGTRVHGVLASYYGIQGNRSPLEWHDQWVARDLADFPEIEDRIRKEADLSRAMLEGYFEWVEETGADEGLTVIGAERQLEYAFEDLGVILQGKLDLRVQREEDGAHMVLDHKTVQNFAQPARVLPMDEQSRTYLLLERLNDKAARTDGVIFNMLRKVKRTATAKPPFYDRFEVRVNDHVLSDFLDRIVREMYDIMAAYDTPDALARAKFYPSPTRDCTWKCPFIGVCSLMDDPSTGYGESLIEVLYEEADPYERYNEETEV